MKRIILSFSLLAASVWCSAETVYNATAIVYQSDKTQEKVDQMDKLVGFTSDQRTKYKTLVEKSEKEKLQLKEKLKGKSSNEQKKLKNEYKSNYEKALKAILTPTQWGKLEATKQKAKDEN